ncbi:MAG: bacteriocin-protection protein [Anaerolineae bacterium]|nr:YdeI/OmpD-associated family protein [Anaerolineales bacterium]MCQ3973742.1 bacteriocin-protection protein [Anaerolineae bacterium]
MKPASTTSGELPIIMFAQPQDWAAWLDKNHATSAGLWLQFARKSSDIPSISYDEALEVALCYGWIDGQKKSHDETSWLQKFTPRGPKSIWSKINREKAQKLIESGWMKPAGLKAVEAAQQDGRWTAAYDPQRTMTVPADFQAELDKNPEAKAFFTALNSRNRYAILHRIQTAKKAETRARRIQQFIEMLARQEKLYP